MTSAAPHHRHTFRDYLELEEMSGIKHEYLNGEVFAMAGATPEHVALVTALSSRLFGLTVGGPCRTYGPDLRVRVLATGLATYPDVAIVCEPFERDPESATHCTNPVAIFEVLSPSTESYDRGEKREHYQRIESLREYVILAQNRRYAEKWTRGTDGNWQHDVIGADGRIDIDAIGGAIVLADLYRDAGL